MAWRSRSREDVEEHKAARRDLEDTGRRQRAAGNREETDAYRDANRRVADTEKNVAWWRR